MRILLSILARLLTLTLVAGLCGCEQSGGIRHAELGGVVLPSAPGFELKDASGRVHRLEELRGSVVLLHFWASWCPPCLEEIPRWLEAAPIFKDMPVKMVAISVDEKWERALGVLPTKRVPSSMISLLDPVSNVAQAYGTRQFPETYVLDRELRVLDKLIGAQDWGGSKIRFLLIKAMGRKK